MTQSTIAQVDANASVDKLNAALIEAGSSGNVAEMKRLGVLLAKAEIAEEAAVKKAEREAKQAAREAALAEAEPITKAFLAAVDSTRDSVAKQMTDAGITGYTIIVSLDKAKVTSAEPIGERYAKVKVPTTRTPSTNGGSRPRVIWVDGAGTEFSSVEAFEHFGPDYYGAEKFATLDTKTASWRVNEQIASAVGLTRKE